MNIRTIYNPVYTAQFWEMENIGEGFYKALQDEYLVVKDRNVTIMLYKFSKGTITNFASVPKLADNLLGIDPVGKHGMGSAIHDMHYGSVSKLYRDLRQIITTDFELRKWGLKVSLQTITEAYGSPEPLDLRKMADIIYLNNMRHLGVSVLSRYTQYIAIRLFGAKYYNKSS